MNKIKEFYKRNPPVLNEISDLKYRHFRFRCQDNRFVKIDRKIATSNKLRDYLLRYKPLDVYYSTSCWLNPERLGSRTCEDITSNIFLYADIVFDIDRKPFSVKNIELARKDTLRLLHIITDNGLIVKYISFSGGKGFHIVCHDSNRYNWGNPRDRETEAIKYRKNLVDLISHYDVEFDRKITVDTRRILRVPGTINPSTGFVCTAITEDQLKIPAVELLKYLPRVIISAPLIPRREMTRIFQMLRTITGRLDRFGVRSRPSDYYASSVSSNVSGLKRQILIMRYSLPKNGLDGLLGKLHKIREGYKLGDIHIFRVDDEIYAVSLETMQEQRVKKILNAAESLNSFTFAKYKQTYMRVGKTFDKTGREFGEVPKYLKTMCAVENRNRYISRPHYRFFKNNGVPLPEYPKQHGGDDVFITHVMIEN